MANVIRYNETKQKHLAHPFMKELSSTVEIWVLRKDGSGYFVAPLNIETLSELLENYLKEKGLELKES